MGSSSWKLWDVGLHCVNSSKATNKRRQLEKSIPGAELNWVLIWVLGV